MAKFEDKHPWLYKMIWPFATVGFILTWVPVRGIMKFKPNWLREYENFVDGPVDGLKEWLHCHPLPFGKQLNIAFMMKNRDRPYWPIIRDKGYYNNCDPEDKGDLK